MNKINIKIKDKYLKIDGVVVIIGDGLVQMS
jgi:hypothetical protein